MVACGCDLFVDWFAVLAGSLLFAMTWWWIAVLVCVGLLLVLLGFVLLVCVVWLISCWWVGVLLGVLVVWWLCILVILNFEFLLLSLGNLGVSVCWIVSCYFGWFVVCLMFDFVLGFWYGGLLRVLAFRFGCLPG